jgi:hypothetical protein
LTVVHGIVYGIRAAAVQEHLQPILASCERYNGESLGDLYEAVKNALTDWDRDETVQLGMKRAKLDRLSLQALQHATADADQPSGFGLTPLTGRGGASDRPPQPGRSGTFPTAKMRWYNLGPSTYRWRFWRGLFPAGPNGSPPPVRSSLVGTLIFTERHLAKHLDRY